MKFVIHRFYGSFKWWNMKSHSRSVHVNFDHYCWCYALFSFYFEQAYKLNPIVKSFTMPKNKYIVEDNNL